MKVRIALLASILCGVTVSVALHERAPRRDALAAALAPVTGDDANAREIARLQKAIASADAPRLLEPLGWAFVARARREDDPGWFKLAERAAQAMLERLPDDDGAELLLGHALASQHRFAEAGRSRARSPRSAGSPPITASSATCCSRRAGSPRPRPRTRR
jgi:hypothetical protein